MGLFDRFKGKKGEEKKSSGKRKENVLDLVREDAPAEDKAKAPKKVLPVKGDTGSAFRVLVRPQLSEKANLLASAGKYVFRVDPGANKPEVKKAIEKVYDVHVRRVNIINMSGKTRRYGRAVGRTKIWKKAIVTVAPGERIEGVTETV